MTDGPLLIGIDCATQLSHTGVACGRLLEEGRVELVEACAASDPVPAQLSAWMGSQEAVVVALDAPLGWPRELGRQLMGHRAGEVVRSTSDRLFRRATDEFIAENFGKRPLEVGADRIARTAVAALLVLEELRLSAHCALPLALKPGPPEQPVAIEVYPAAVLLSLGLPATGYKGAKPASVARRTEIVEALRGSHLHATDALAQAMCDSDHVLDAALCVLAASHFVEQEVYRPPDERLAAREGWIWARPPGVRM